MFQEAVNNPRFSIESHSRPSISVGSGVDGFVDMGFYKRQAIIPPFSFFILHSLHCLLAWCEIFRLLGVRSRLSLGLSRQIPPRASALKCLARRCRSDIIYKSPRPINTGTHSKKKQPSQRTTQTAAAIPLYNHLLLELPSAIFTTTLSPRPRARRTLRTKLKPSPGGSGTRCGR